MLRDRYDPVDIFARVPQLSHQIDPVLAQLDTLLDDDTLFQQVKTDLSQRLLIYDHASASAVLNATPCSTSSPARSSPAPTTPAAPSSCSGAGWCTGGLLRC